MSSSTLRKLIALPVLLVLGWIVLQYLLPILSPFLLAGLLALAAEPVVGFHIGGNTLSIDAIHI